APNYPNPFRKATSIVFEQPERAFVSVRVYNILGQEVARLLSEEREAGAHTVQWNGLDNHQQPVAGGIYFITLWRQSPQGKPQLVARQKISVIR
ncbi:MAG: T9SS C-terminal target domain-containing protein, partial [Calditrichaeota bacterium]